MHGWMQSQMEEWKEDVWKTCLARTPACKLSSKDDCQCQEHREVCESRQLGDLGITGIWSWVILSMVGRLS
jgi:hypothetical protein